MVEKPNFEEASRFSYVLSTNGHIICKRDIIINNFKEYSLGSVQLSEAVESCVDLIKKDLVEKSNIYLWYTSPQVFKNKEEMEKWAACPAFSLEVPSFVVLDDSEETFLWNGERMEPYKVPFNKGDYAKSSEEQQPCILKFAFLDNGREVSSLSWDGSVYPKFIRTNIDIQNTKNKFAAEGVYAPVESFITDRFIKTQKDLFPELTRILRSACSRDNVKYYSTIEMGGKTYDINITGQQDAYYKKAEADCRKKTKAYFNGAI